MTLKQTKDPIPRDNGPVQCDWLDNASVRVNEHGATLGLLPADTSKFTAWCTMAKDACAGLSNAVTTADAWRDYREDLLYGSTTDNVPLTRPVDNTSIAPILIEPLLPGAMTRIRDFLQGLKRKQAWSAAIEADFRITPITVEIDVDTAKPEVIAKAMPGAEVNHRWIVGPFDGVVAEWQLVGAAAWNSLGTITGSRYTHVAALAVPNQPERRNYRFRFALNNKAVGEWSDTIPVTVRP